MVNPDFQPAWLTDELNKLLDALPRDAYHRKRRTTVLRLAEAAATGQTEHSVFAQPDCCSWKTWDGQYRDKVKKPGWRHDPRMQAALAEAKRRAQWWMDQAEARRLAKRIENYAEAKDLLAEYAPHGARRLFVLMGQSESDMVRLKAATEILDRADEATASKAITKGENVQRVQFDLSGLPTELLQLLADAGDEADAEAGREGGTE